MPSHNIHENAVRKRYCKSPAINAQVTYQHREFYNREILVKFAVHTLFPVAVSTPLTNIIKPIKRDNTRLKWMKLRTPLYIDFLEEKIIYNSSLCYKHTGMQFGLKFYTLLGCFWWAIIIKAPWALQIRAFMIIISDSTACLFNYCIIYALHLSCLRLVDMDAGETRCFTSHPLPR